MFPCLVLLQRLGMKRQLDANSHEYHNELERQAEIRYNQRQREKAEEQRLALEVWHKFLGF